MFFLYVLSSTCCVCCCICVHDYNGVWENIQGMAHHSSSFFFPLSIFLSLCSLLTFVKKAYLSKYGAHLSSLAHNVSLELTVQMTTRMRAGALMHEWWACVSLVFYYCACCTWCLVETLVKIKTCPLTS